MITVHSAEALSLVEFDDLEGEDPVPEEGPKLRAVQVSTPAYERVTRVAEATGISRAQIIDFLLMRMTAREISQALKAEKITRRPVGRRKKRFHA